MQKDPKNSTATYQFKLNFSYLYIYVYIYIYIHACIKLIFHFFNFYCSANGEESEYKNIKLILKNFKK